jgi:hypothetical protein
MNCAPRIKLLDLQNRICDRRILEYMLFAIQFSTVAQAIWFVGEGATGYLRDLVDHICRAGLGAGLPPLVLVAL